MIKVICCDTPAQKQQWLTEALQDHFQFFDDAVKAHRSYILAIESGEVVGLCVYRPESGRFPGYVGLGVIETRKDRRHQGISRLLADALMQTAASLSRGLCVGHYEPDGERWLKPVFAKLKESYPDVAVLEL